MKKINFKDLTKKGNRWVLVLATGILFVSCSMVNSSSFNEGLEDGLKEETTVETNQETEISNVEEQTEEEYRPNPFKEQKEEEEQKAKEEAEKKAQEEKAKEEAEQKAKEEEEQRQKEEAEAKAKAEEEAKQQELIKVYEVAQQIVDNGNSAFGSNLSYYTVDEENKAIMVCVDAPMISELAGYVLVLPTSDNLTSWNELIGIAKDNGLIFKSTLELKGLDDWHIMMLYGSVEKDSYHIIILDDAIMYDAVNENLK